MLVLLWNRTGRKEVAMLQAVRNGSSVLRSGTGIAGLTCLQCHNNRNKNKNEDDRGHEDAQTAVGMVCYY